MSDSPYEPPQFAVDTDGSSAWSRLRFAIYLIVPSMMIATSLLAGVIPLWQAPLFIGAGFLMIWGAEMLGTWLFARNLSRSQKAIRWVLYAVPVATWAISKMYFTYGIVASAAIALAIMPGLLALLIWEKPPHGRGR